VTLPPVKYYVTTMRVLTTDNDWGCAVRHLMGAVTGCQNQLTLFN
jgi:hypothetical protein